jgi:thymidylate kinase
VPLGVIGRLLGALHAADIAYCHWKSNEHLRAALAGDTDLDLLVDRRSAPALGLILAETGFKRFDVQPGHGYSGIEDYLALDLATGRLVHLHLHYQLTVGEPYLKGYHLPWEELVLETRILDQHAGVYVADPHLEFVLLAVRAAMKLRLRDFVLALLGGRYLRGGTLREIRWLAERVEAERLLEVGRLLVGGGAARRLPGLASSSGSAWQIHAFRRRIVPNLKGYRTYGPLTGRWLRWRRELRALWGRFRRRYLNAYPPAKRTVARGGAIIALIGADGSGKSTVTREVTRWLGWKVDLLPIYLGSGSGPVSHLRRPLLIYGALRSLRLRGVGRRRRGRVPSPEGQYPNPKGLHGVTESKQPVQEVSTPSPKVESPGAEATPSIPRRGTRSRLARRIWQVLWGWTLYREKRARLERARRARGRGRVVICDRYPQDQVMGFNDGPLLSSWLEHPSRILRVLALREAEAYRAAGTYPPDLVIRLVVAPEIAWRRKPERSLASLRERTEAIRALRFPPRTRVVEVDASQPLDRVLLEVKRAIWESL